MRIHRLCVLVVNAQRQAKLTRHNDLRDAREGRYYFGMPFIRTLRHRFSDNTWLVIKDLLIFRWLTVHIHHGMSSVRPSSGLSAMRSRLLALLAKAPTGPT